MAGENKNKTIISTIMIILVLVLFIRKTEGLTQQLTVIACNTPLGCSPDGWNDRDNTNDGSNVSFGTSDTLTMSKPTFDNRSVINNIIVGHNRGRSAANINGNINYTFRNAAGTVYCTSSATHAASYTYTIITPVCSWDYINLSDLMIVVRHTGDRQILYNDYINFTINYTPYVDFSAPNISLGQPNDNSWKTVSTFSFFFTPYDENNISNCSLIIDNKINLTKKGSENITLGIENNMTSTLSDGIYNWTVNCTDSWNNTGTNSSQKIIRVDTTPPMINLESPGNNTPWSLSPDVLFKFNTSDFMTNISSCELIIDNQIRDTVISPSEDTSLNFTFAPGNGEHYWSVNCTDGNGWENSSLTYNVTVSYAGRTVQPDKTSYQQGENVTITGNNWNDGVVTIQLMYPNSTILLWNTTAVAGLLNTLFFINYSYPIDLYNITAYEFTIPSNNASSSFNVTPRPVSLNVDRLNYFQGEKIRINGSGYSPSATVTLIIDWAGGSNITNVSADINGFFEYNHTLNYTSILGVYNLTAYDFYYPNLNDTVNLTVNQRVADVSADKSSYSLNENVYIRGSWFTNNGTVNLTIYDNATNTTAPFFPTLISANSSGNFSYVWNVTDTCPGVFIIKAVDTDNLFLNDTISFIITGVTVPYDYQPVASYEGDGGVSVLNNLLTMDDANNESLTIGGTNPNYLGMNFSYSISPTANIDTIRLWYKHYVSDSSRVNFLRLEWLNASVWQTVSGCSITNPPSNTLEYCDLNNYVKNGSQANDLRLRAYYERSTGGTYYAYIDYAHINLTASGTATCTDWDNQPPAITAMIMDDSQISPSNQIDLIPGSTRTVFCNVSVYDFNGYQSITGANSTLYHESKTSSSQDLNMSHYFTDCAETGNNGVDTKNFSCQFNIWYWALNGTWFCNVTAKSNWDVVSDKVNSTINPLYALNMTNSIDFGIMEPMEISSLDVVGEVTNLGNMVLDLGLDGYGVFNGDNMGMNCSVEGNISLDSERYSLNPGEAWSAMTPLTDLTSYITDFDLNPRNDTNITRGVKEVYWKLQVDLYTKGECNGTVVFTASAG